MAGPEHRQFPRYAVDANIDLTTEDGTIVGGRTRNLSRGGFCLETEAPVEAGAHVAAQLTLFFGTNQTSEPLSLPARVVWCTPLGDGYQVGTQLGALSPDQATYWDVLLRYLEDPDHQVGATTSGDDDDSPFDL